MFAWICCIVDVTDMRLGIVLLCRFLSLGKGDGGIG